MNRNIITLSFITFFLALNQFTCFSQSSANQIEYKNFNSKKFNKGDKIITRGIYFSFDDNQILLKESRKALDSITKFLSEHPTFKIEIGFHSDSRGMAEYNLILSEKRAQTIREYIVENYKIKENRLTHKGYGESQLLNDHNGCTSELEKEEVYQSNRRVELKILMI